jgi:hypothetical protein
LWWRISSPFLPNPAKLESLEWTVLGNFVTWSTQIFLEVAGNCNRKIVAWGFCGPRVDFDGCPPAPKVNGPCVHCARTESILALFEAKFRLDLIVGFVTKDVIINHGALLKIHDGRSIIMSVINRFWQDKPKNWFWTKCYSLT